MPVDGSQAPPDRKGAQRLHGARVVPAATYLVNGIQVTVGIDEKLDQGREVVSHSQVNWRGTLLRGETHGSTDGSLPGLPSCRWVLGDGTREGYTSCFWVWRVA